jgi:hypothetical protein
MKKKEISIFKTNKFNNNKIKSIKIYKNKIVFVQNKVK